MKLRAPLFHKYMFNYHHFKNGFSLIELVVVISIIAVVTGASVNVYKNSVIERRLPTDVKLITSIIEETKQRARARDVSPDANCTNFQSYNLIINPTTKTISQLFLCDGNSQTIAEYQIEYTVFEQPTSTIGLTFISPTGEHTSPEPTLILKNLSTKMCVSIEIPQIQTVIVSDPFSC